MTADGSTAFFVTGGTLRPDARCYVERQADRDLFEALLRGEFCYVLTSRQMGKSSLMVRAAVKLREQGIAVIVLDLSAIGLNLNAEQWHNGLLAGIGRQLGLEDELESYWDAHSRLSPMQRLIGALRDVALAQRQEPLVIFVDELDVVRSLPFKTDEFFAAIRACSNRRAEDPEFQRLTFCLLGVATPSDLIQDSRITPFNIARRIELHDFTRSEAAPLAKGLQGGVSNPAAAEVALERILHWTNGHPYLTQRLCKAVAARQDQAGAVSGRHVTFAVDELCEELFLSDRARERDDNLVFVRDRILRLEADRAALLHFYEQVLARRGAADDETSPVVADLRLAGIVRREGERLRVRNRIYARAFDRRWIESNMPDAEKVRQREAYRRGVMRTSAVAAAIVLVMGGLAALALWSRDQAKSATWAALRDQARLSRLSGLAGQRFGSLASIGQAWRIKTSPELRDEAIACLALPDLRKQPGCVLPEANRVAVAFSDDLRSYAFSTSAGDIVLRAVDGNRELARWRTTEGPAARIWFAPDARYLALAQTNRGGTALSLWQCSPPKLLFALTNRMPMEAFSFSPDRRHVATGGEDGAVRIFTLPEGKPEMELDMGMLSSVVRYDAEGGRLAVASSESLTIKIYELSAGKLVKSLHAASPPTYLAWHPGGLLLAAAGQDNAIRLWELDADDEFPKQELPAQAGAIRALEFNHSGSLLASAGADETIRLWRPGNTRPLLTLSESDSVPQLRFTPDDQHLGFALSGREVCFWEVAAGDECRTLFDFESDDLSAIDIHPDGGLLATAHRNGVTFWDLVHGRMLARMPVGGTATVRFQPVSGDLVSAEFRGTYRFQIERPGQGDPQVLRLKPKEDFYLGPGAKALDFARDTDVLAVAYDDRIRLARNTNSAYAVLAEFIGEPGFQSVALSPDGRLLAAGNWSSGEVWLWDRSNDFKPRRLRLEGHAQVRFSPDGRWLATGTERMVALWDTHTWQPAVQVERPRGAVRPASVAFAPGGNRNVWALALSDTQVRILDFSGRTIANLERPDLQSLVGLAFSPDGSRLVCATAARAVLVWNLHAVAHDLAQLGLETELRVVAEGQHPDTLPMAVEIGALDRLRFSEAKHILGLRREVGDLTDLIRRDPGNWVYRCKRAERHRALREYTKAIEDYEEWIRLDRAASPLKDAKDQAWPLRDLALVYLSGPNEMRNYEKALTLTEEALKLDGENADNHFRRGLACYQLGRYEAAESSLEIARRAWAVQKKNLAVVLFYEAMCQAHQQKLNLAAQSLERARQDYARTDLRYRESHAEELADLLWEAERVVGETIPGG